MKTFEVKETKKTSSNIKIAVVGVGGGGCNMLRHVVKSVDTTNMELVAINTDKQALDNIVDEKIKKIQIGKKLTKGLG